MSRKDRAILIAMAAAMMIILIPMMVWADIQDRAAERTGSATEYSSRTEIVDSPAVKITLPPVTEMTTEETESESIEESCTIEETIRKTEAPTAVHTEAPEPETEEPTHPAEIQRIESVGSVGETEGQTVIPIYSCHGEVLDPALQEYAYGLLCGYGMRSYYEYFIAQAYQESTYQADQRTLNHGEWDCGLMQIRECYWQEWSQESGIVGDIMDPYVNVRMACYILSRYWIQTGDVAETISLYMAGYGGPWQEEYVRDVTSHMAYLARIN